MRICPNCGKPLEVQDQIGRQEICPHCRSDLHCCLNCQLYDEYAQNKCREPSADWVGDRGKNNFCEYFRFQESSTRDRQFREREEARAKLEGLFKKKTS
ncbi:MAG: hypothetical protein A2Z51_08740 [Deltaproteobacteria bacterium RBG_19FT_COMBO_52_11]|nr:MAG: hypothetical protein A2Z51_08740 [Deltaproteobacteria bacterium RBG_19FT_COMBO_52_11]